MALLRSAAANASPTSETRPDVRRNADTEMFGSWFHCVLIMNTSSTLVAETNTKNFRVSRLASWAEARNSNKILSLAHVRLDTLQLDPSNEMYEMHR
jgi:hypothetical protein